MKWKELTKKMNSDGTGDRRSEEKWRKVWRDYKNDTKKKLANIKKVANGTSGRPVLLSSMTDLENRVMQIIEVQATNGTGVKEAFEQVKETPTPQPEVQTEEENVGVQDETQGDSHSFLTDWNKPSTSYKTVVPRPPAAELRKESTENSRVTSHSPVQESCKPSVKKTKKYYIRKIFKEAERNERKYEIERDRVFEQLERETLRQRDEELRLREFELHERLGQRGEELEAQWMEFMKEAMNVIARNFEKHDEKS